MPAFTPRNVAKYVAKATVHAGAANVTETAMVNHTRFEEDDTIVDIASHVVGWYVSSKTKPLTDKMVDSAADFIVATKANIAAKKTAKSEE